MNRNGTRRGLRMGCGEALGNPLMRRAAAKAVAAGKALPARPAPVRETARQ
jgi:hypothetical protein